MNEQINERGTQKRLHTKFHTMNNMRSGARPIKQSISRACRNHAFGIHESRQIFPATTCEGSLYTHSFSTMGTESLHER